MSPKNCVAGDCIVGWRSRSNTNSYVWAVTSSVAAGGEKPKPSRIVKVYVRPSLEIVGMASATSGTSVGSKPSVSA
jgi:hypothetical protein